MKKTQYLVICLTLCLTAFGQQQSKIQAPYGNWHKINLHSASYVSISYALAKCNTNNGRKDLLVGQSYYRIRVQYPRKGRVQFKFDWRGCDGKKGTEKVTVDMSKEGIDAGEGMFFFGYEAGEPYDVIEEETQQVSAQTNSNPGNAASPELENKLKKSYDGMRDQIHDTSGRPRIKPAQHPAVIGDRAENYQPNKQAETMAISSPTQPTKNNNSQLVNTYQNAAGNSDDIIMKSMYENMAKAASKAPDKSIAEQQRQADQVNSVQEKYAKSIQTLNAVGGVLTDLLAASNKNLDAELARSKVRIENFYEQMQKDNELSLSDNLDNASRAFHEAQAQYNGIQLISYKKFNDELFNSYYPLISKRKDETDGGYTYLNLPGSLPPLLYVPTCKCFTGPGFTTKFDTAFYYLRQKDICNQIEYHGQFLKVEYNKNIPDVFNEETALINLKKAVSDFKYDKKYDRVTYLNYCNSFVWVGYLQNKNARTVQDISDGIDVLSMFTDNARNYQEGVDYLLLEGLVAFIEYFKAQLLQRLNYIKKHSPEYKSSIP